MIHTSWNVYSDTWCQCWWSMQRSGLKSHYRDDFSGIHSRSAQSERLIFPRPWMKLPPVVLTWPTEHNMAMSTSPSSAGFSHFDSLAAMLVILLHYNLYAQLKLRAFVSFPLSSSLRFPLSSPLSLLLLSFSSSWFFFGWSFSFSICRQANRQTSRHFGPSDTP